MALFGLNQLLGGAGQAPALYGGDPSQEAAIQQYASMPQQQPAQPAPDAQDDSSPFENFMGGINPKLAFLSQLFAQMAGQDSPIWSAYLNYGSEGAKQHNALKLQQAKALIDRGNYDYEAAHPKPTNEMINIAATGAGYGTPQAQDMARQSFLSGISKYYPVQAGGALYGSVGGGTPQPAIMPNPGNAPTGAPAGGALAPPKPGDIVAGHKFLGGNPKDPSSWQAIGGPTPPASGNFRSTGIIGTYQP